MSFEPGRNAARSRDAAADEPRRPQLPRGVCVYAVGDIHGRWDLLQRALQAIDADIRHYRFPHVVQVFLGDYVDRGSHSRETIEGLIARGRTHQCVFLKGNHEAILLGLLNNALEDVDWRSAGLLPTMQSYGVTPSLKPDRAEERELIKRLAAAFPPDHREFLQNLRTSYACGDYFFVHAGVRPGVALQAQQEHDLMWIRGSFLNSDESFEKYIVHGHTPVTRPDVRANRMNIDTGAFATNNLTVVRLFDSTFAVL
jgi:serine/threonine protein phosphatase 1